MNLREAILQEHSRAHTLAISQWVGDNPQRIAALMQLFMHGEYRVVQRAAWIVSYVARSQPALMAPYLPQLVQRMQDTGTHVAVKRNVLRILQETELPESLHGDMMHTCFDIVINPDEAVAVRAFALGILGRLSLVYTGIRNELQLVIEDLQSQDPAAALRSKTRQVLQMMRRAPVSEL